MRASRCACPRRAWNWCLAPALTRPSWRRWNEGLGQAATLEGALPPRLRRPPGYFWPEEVIEAREGIWSDRVMGGVMGKERLYLYDTTLRDGQQTQGVSFSTAEKQRIAEMLDALGIDYIEGGWPGANPTDSAFFDAAPQTRAKMTAFGMTKRAGRSAENDDVLAAVLNAGTGAVCIVGKSHDFHVKTALGISLEENTANIAQSIGHIVGQGREPLFDAEHFFDGYKSNPRYAVACCLAAFEGGARWIVLCDTNGGTLPQEIGEITAQVIKAGIPGERLGIHTHNDTENAVAGSLAAVEAGARQIQGTLNGLGERCGNANLTTLIPTLILKDPFASQFETGVTH